MHWCALKGRWASWKMPFKNLSIPARYLTSSMSHRPYRDISSTGFRVCVVCLLQHRQNSTQAEESVWEVAKIDFHIPFRFPLLLKQLKLSASTKNTTCGNRGCHTDSEACATKKNPPQGGKNSSLAADCASF